MFYHLKHNLFLASLPFFLLACGGGSGGSNSSSSSAPPTYTIGGNVSGLSTGNTLTLSNNGTDAKTITVDGGFAFTNTLLSGNPYAVTVAAQPTDQICTVLSGTGTVAATNVNTVLVTCVNTYTVSGTVTGHSGSVTLTNNGSNAQTVLAGSSSFSFAAQNAGTSWNVAITSPAGQACTVTAGNATGSNISANQTVTFNCVNTYTVSGTVTGLSTSGLVLQLNSANNLTIASGASTFVFGSPLSAGTNYIVTILTQPSGQSCFLSNAIGNSISANVINVSISCSTGFTVGGSVTGLATGKSVTLLNNLANSTPVSSNTSFTFSTPLATGASYLVTIGTQPAGQICSVSNGTGTIGTTNVNNISVTCANSFSVGGSVTGLGAGKTVVLNNNGTDAKSITVNGAFTFTTAVASGANYLVTVATQPAGQTCLVVNGSGSIGSTSINNVAVLCQTTTYTVSVTLSGLGAGMSVVLLNNGTNALTAEADGSFTFTTPLAPGAYAVTVQSQPVGQTCTVSAGSGTITSNNISNVVVTCTNNATNLPGNCSDASNARIPTSDPFWTIYSAPTNVASDSTPIINKEQTDPFGSCLLSPP